MFTQSFGKDFSINIESGRSLKATFEKPKEPSNKSKAKYKWHGTGHLDFVADPWKPSKEPCPICGGKPGKDRGKHETTKKH